MRYSPKMRDCESVSNLYKISDLVSSARGTLATQPVSGISMHSAQVATGQLFFACAQDPQHRALHAQESLANGAVAVVTEDDTGLHSLRSVLVVVPDVRDALGTALATFYGQVSRTLNLFGVTGTDGKTSVCSFIAQILSNVGKRCGVIGTLGSRLGDKVLATSMMTTPDPVDLHERLAQMHAMKADGVALEVSSHALKQKRTAGLYFDSAVFTNLSDEHLDYHENREDYAHSKSLLFRQAGLKRCVLNADDASAAYMAQNAHAECVYYSTGDAVTPTRAQVRASATHFDVTGIRADVRTPWGDGQLHAPVLGHFNLSNILAAIATLGGRDVPIAQIFEATTQLQAPVGRMQLVPNGLDLYVVVDFAHTANGLRHSLHSARMLCPKRLWCVFGCGGERDTSKRARMGAHASQTADRIILTDDNPRGEDSADIIQDILSGIDDTNKVTVLPDRGEAIMYALREAQAGDLVVVAGKGHESDIEKAGARLPFNDAQHIARCLRKIEALRT